jgi:hypothetical protein
MSKEHHFQFFTTDQNLIHGTWFPIDHFFYAPCIDDPNTGGLVEDNKVVHLETHASVGNKSGFAVSVVQGETYEEYDDIPSALRRMADIIEAHTKSLEK